MKTEKQAEFKGMPPMTDLGKKATEYVDVFGNIGTWKDKLETIKVELIDLFKKEKRTTICIDGITLNYVYIEKEQIKVKKPE